MQQEKLKDENVNEVEAIEANELTDLAVSDAEQSQVIGGSAGTFTLTFNGQTTGGATTGGTTVNNGAALHLKP